MQTSYAEAEAEVETYAEAEAEVETYAEAEAEAEVETYAEAEAEAEVETYAEAEAEAEVETYEMMNEDDDVESYNEVQEEEEEEKDYEKDEVLLHPAAVSRKSEAYIKSMIFDKLCCAVDSAVVQKRLFMMYHEVGKGPFLLGYRYNQIFRYVISLNTI